MQALCTRCRSTRPARSLQYPGGHAAVASVSLLAALLPEVAGAQQPVAGIDSERRTMTAERMRDDERIVLDGLLDELVWTRAGLYTGRSTRDQTAVPMRHTAGVDFLLATSTFRGDQNLELSGKWVWNSTADGAGRSAAWGLRVESPNDIWEWSAEVEEVQQNHDPAVGFTARHYIRRYAPEVSWNPRPRNHPWIRQLGFGVEPELNDVDLPEGRFQTTLYRLVADTQFSPFIYLVNNVQYDSVSRIVGWQGRFRWILTPGNDLFVVYTRILDRSDGARHQRQDAGPARRRQGGTRSGSSFRLQAPSSRLQASGVRQAEGETRRPPTSNLRTFTSR
jgi:hypothetical protein